MAYQRHVYRLAHTSPGEVAGEGSPDPFGLRAMNADAVSDLAEYGRARDAPVAGT